MKLAIGGADFGPFRREVDLVPAAQALPCHAKMRMPMEAGALLCATGIGTLVLALWGFRQGQHDLGLLIALVSLIVLGMMSVALGLHCWIAVAEWEFTRNTVAHRARGIFGRLAWEEPLSAYRGVLARESWVPDRGSGFTCTVSIVELKHTVDRNKDVQLYYSRRPTELLAKQEHYARLFGLPAITPTVMGE